MYRIETHILERIENTITEYSMFQKDEKLLVALSGGKDSLFISIALMELGYLIQPVIIDMGYEMNWGRNLIKMFSSYEIIPFIIDARDTLKNRKLEGDLQKDIENRLKFLDNFKPDNHITPCTMCYNAKIILLSNYAHEKQITKIVFGHHGSDAITSFLKSALMYIDRWDSKHEVYDRNNFHQLIENIKPSFLNSYEKFKNSKFPKKLQELTLKRLISTDEPPVQKYLNDKTINILRPLFRVFEDAIINFKKINKLSTLGSGCSHSLARETNTPRELIQYELVHLLFENPDSELIQNWLINLLSIGLEKDGSLIFNARNERESILGRQYKTTKGCETKF